MAPFIAERVYLGDPPDIELATCSNCGFAWFTVFPSLAEQLRLYCGYRGDEYQHQRQKHEPDYTPEFNDSLSVPPKRTLSADTALDYGGDGSRLDARVRYAHDINGFGPAPGARRWRGEPVDLVVCCNVLEHVADPLALVAELSILGDLYIEVPAKRPTRPMMHEHINFFTPRSLELMTGESFEVVDGTICGMVDGEYGG